jgi:hypothetical protein
VPEHQNDNESGNNNHKNHAADRDADDDLPIESRGGRRLVGEIRGDYTLRSHRARVQPREQLIGCRRCEVHGDYEEREREIEREQRRVLSVPSSPAM